MKLSRLILAVAAVFGLASCLEIKSTVIVSKDGSAIVEETALLGAQLAAMMAQGGGAGGPGEQLKGLIMDKEQAEKRAKDLGEGVTVKSIEEVKSPDGKSGTKVTFAVADIRKMTYKPNTPDKEEGGEKKEDDKMTFALEGSTLTITNPQADKKSESGDKPKKSAEEIAQMKAQVGMMKPMFAGMRVSIEVKAASGIASTDASHREGEGITYLDVQFDKLLNNIDAFAEVMESGDSGLTMAEAAKKFEKVEGLKIEGKKVVKVELK
ncbi:MAG: hypothetical protein IPK22_28335 [Verrucomicrobiaceae bacterium]|nr:hypothetical protein [Verrucomicrobiaceae bacterium]